MTTVNLGTTEQATAVTILAPSLAMPPSRPPADHEAGDVLQEHQRHPALVAQLDEVGPLERRLGEEDAVVGDDAHREAPDLGEAADQGRAVERLELVEPAAVDDAADHLAHVVGRAGVGRHDVVERRRVLCGSSTAGTAVQFAHAGLGTLARVPGTAGCRRSRARSRGVGVVLGEVVDDPGGAGVDVGTAELLGGDLLPGRGLHQRRAAEEDRALVAHDDRLVRHRRHVGAAGGARAHHGGDLGDARADRLAWL